ncbi:hypothetical protein G6F43_011122 [Rhizopus delemar]|nr:hypothetical protein G6F43_011122 [Rhizopus delemar]
MTNAQRVSLIWNNRFILATNKEDAVEIDAEKVNWSELLEDGIEKSKEVIEQSIRSKRNFMIWDTYEKENEVVGQIIAKRQAEDFIEKDGKGKKALRTAEDIVQFDNILQKDGVKEKAEETPADGSVNSQESRNVNVLSEDSGQKIQTCTSVPFLDIVYNESEIDSSYKGKQSATETEESSSSSAIGHSMYGNAHKVAMNNALKPDDMDIKLFLSGLFDCPKPTKMMEQYLVPIARLPENIISCVKSMEKTIDDNTIMKIEGAQLNSVEELALHHITLSIYLNHSVNSNEWQSGEIDFIARSTAAFEIENCELIERSRDFGLLIYETEFLLENMWSIWNDALYDMLTDDHDDKDIHGYSLEYLGIIILGRVA